MAAEAGDGRARIALFAAVALGLWPYLGTADFGPMTLDAVHWIQRASGDGAERWEWIFRSAHFIAYRPVTALSYWMTGMDGGNGLHRVFDLALHATNGVLVFAVARRLAGVPVIAAVLAGAFFLCHPVAEEVVPWIARRSYALATAFSLGCLWATLRAVGPSARTRHTVVAAACLWLAVLSNEVAFTVAAILPAWAFAASSPHTRSLRAALRASAPAVAVAAIAVLIRSVFVDGVGGYSPDTNLDRFAAVYAGFWRDLIAFRPEYTSERSSLRSTLIALGIVGTLGCAAYSALALRAGRAVGPLLVVLACWLGFASVLLSAQNVWFSRELLPLIPALALWLAITLSDALRWRRAWAAAPIAVFVVVLAHSPALRGPDDVRMTRWHETQAVLEDLTAALDEAAKPTWVGLALGYTREQRHGSVRARARDLKPPRFLRIPQLWLGPRYAAQGHQIETLIGLPGTRDAPARATLFESHGAPLLRVFGEGAMERFPKVPAPSSAENQPRTLSLQLLDYPSGLTPRFYLYVDGEGRFVSLPRRRS